jgi:hypothetical protein
MYSSRHCRVRVEEGGDKRRERERERGGREGE